MLNFPFGRVWFATGLLAVFTIAGAAPGETLPVTVQADGLGPSQTSLWPSVNGSGTALAFTSFASNLVSGDTNGLSDVFVVTLNGLRTVRISLGPDGEQSLWECAGGSVSDDGRYAVFASPSQQRNWVGWSIVGSPYLRDLHLGTTRPLSVMPNGSSGHSSDLNPQISGDGQFAMFISWLSFVPADKSGSNDIYIRRLDSPQFALVSIGIDGREANGVCLDPTMSSDGRFIAFLSGASNLILEGENGAGNIFVRDMVAGTTKRVITGTPELRVYSPKISASGQFVVYCQAPANSEVGSNVYIKNLVTGQTNLVSAGLDGEPAGSSFGPSVSSDGRYVAFRSRSKITTDSRQNRDALYVRDMALGQTRFISETWVSNTHQRSSISDDGGLVAYLPSEVPTNLIPKPLGTVVFVEKVQTGEVTLVSLNNSLTRGNGNSGEPHISFDGTRVFFTSRATNLISGPTPYDSSSVYVRDMNSRTTTLLSEGMSNEVANESSAGMVATPDGRFVLFTSRATNLVPGDNVQRTYSAVFLRNTLTGTTEMVSLNSDGVPANGWATAEGISPNGRYVAFHSRGSNLGQAGEKYYVRDRQTGITSYIGPAERPNHSRALVLSNTHVVFHSDDASLLPEFQGDSPRLQLFARNLETGELKLISVATNGKPSRGGMEEPYLSLDGKHLAFSSLANDLVEGVTVVSPMCFVYSFESGKIELVSLTSEELIPNSPCRTPSLSHDGRYVLFHSDASNLGPPQTVFDPRGTFVRDRALGITYQLPIRVFGGFRTGYHDYDIATLSADGKFVVYSANNEELVDSNIYGKHMVKDIYRHELASYGTKVEGKITLQDFLSAGRTVDFELRPAGGGEPENLLEVPVDANGNFRFGSMRVGSFRLSVKSSTFLRRTLPTDFVLNGSGLSNVNISLVNGDCDGDNEVTIFDYILLSQSFGLSPTDSAWLAEADLDGDQLVTIFDYVILSNSFGLRGDD